MLSIDEFQKPERLAQSNAWKHLKKLLNTRQQAESELKKLPLDSDASIDLEAVIERAETELRKMGKS